MRFLNKSMGTRNREGIGLSYRPGRLHRLVELIPWNRFLGSLKVYKFGLSSPLMCLNCLSQRSNYFLMYMYTTLYLYISVHIFHINKNLYTLSLVHLISHLYCTILYIHNSYHDNEPRERRSKKRSSTLLICKIFC